VVGSIPAEISPLKIKYFENYTITLAFAKYHFRYFPVVCIITDTTVGTKFNRYFSVQNQYWVKDTASSEGVAQWSSQQPADQRIVGSSAARA
jgi:hypothetical protein